MTGATKVLRDEHDAILRMLEVTEAVAGQLESGQAVPADTLGGLLEFFRLFADRLHHGKEEDLLFPLLEEKGVPREGGPVGVMLAEHEQGRALIRQMAEKSAAYAEGSAEAGAGWVGPARQYVELLRQHIDKENNILFVAAEKMLSADEQGELAKQFDKVQEEKLGADTHRRLRALVDTLSADTLSN
jgi:hemerythrin-like domain-containing protein